MLYRPYVQQYAPFLDEEVVGVAEGAGLALEEVYLLQDRACYPDTLCREPADNPNRDVMTFSSLVAVPARGEMWVAMGPPNRHTYRKHTFSA